MSTKMYEKYYSKKSFWDKVIGGVKSAGKEVFEKALYLYYAMKNPECPAWAKSVIIGALGYFIFPADMIPDPIPVAGYTDDIAVMTAAIATIAMYIDEEVKQKAKQKLEDLFG